MLMTASIGWIKSMLKRKEKLYKIKIIKFIKGEMKMKKREIMKKVFVFGLLVLVVFWAGSKVFEVLKEIYVTKTEINEEKKAQEKAFKKLLSGIRD